MYGAATHEDKLDQHIRLRLAGPELGHCFPRVPKPIARARGVPGAVVREVIAAHIERPQLGVLGDPRVNARAVNRALDARIGAQR
jgi:K+-transporting ATPase c subunit